MSQSKRISLEHYVVGGALLSITILSSASIGLTMTFGPWLALVLDATIGLIAAAFSFALARRVAVSLRILTAAAHHIGRDPLQTSLPLVGGVREIVELSTALRSSFRRLDAASPGTLWDGQEKLPANGGLQMLASPRGRQAKADLLTGVLSRHAFLALTEDAIPYFKRYGRSVATMVIDIDDFETLQEGLGRDDVEQIIRHVADVVSLSVRVTDKVSRFGASEFVVLLREIDEIQAAALAARMRASVGGIPLRVAERALSITVSIGVAIASSEDEDIQALIQRADQALYVTRRRAAAIGNDSRSRLEPAV